MNLSDEFRSLMGDAGRAMSDLSEATGGLYGKAKERAHTFNESQKTQAQIGERKRAIQMAYARIGEAIYEAHKDDTSVDPAYAEEFDKIRAARAELAALEETLRNLQNGRVCPNCGDTVSSSDVFCPKCGNRL